MVMAFALFTGIDTCAKWLAGTGTPVWQIAFVRFSVHAALVVALLLPGEPRLLRANRPRIVVARALCLLAGTVLNFFAVRHLPLPLTSTISFTVPLLVCALAVPFLGEQVGPRRWAAIVLGFVGVIVATQPWGASFHWAVALSFGTALSAAAYSLLTRRLAGVESSATLQLYASLLPALAVAPLALPVWIWPSDAAGWVALSLIGGFGFAGHQLLTLAHRFAPASALAPFIYTQLAFMTLSGWAIFGDAPDAALLAGAGIVLASGLYVWRRELRLARDAAAASPGREKEGKLVAGVEGRSGA